MLNICSASSASRTTADLARDYENMAHFLESISSSVYTLDRDYCFIYFNKAFEEYANTICSSDLRGKCFWDLFPQLKQDEAYKFYHTAMTERVAQHFEFLSPYTNKWTDTYIYPSPGGGISVCFNDITDKKEAELALSRSQLLFSTVFHASPTIMSIRCLRTDHYVEVNDAWVKAVGYSRDEAIGKTPIELAGAIRENISSATIIKINGEDCALVVSVDITQQRALEREMQRLEKLNLIGQMAGGVGHEIRNPLTVVRGFLQLLQGKYADSSQQFEIMISEIDRANGIITEFLALAKTKPDEQKQGCLNEVIGRIYPMLQARAAQLCKELHFYPSDIPPLLISEPEMRQILLNITINAIEACQKAVSIRTYYHENEVIVEIANDGPAIPPEIQVRLGTPFFTTKDHGTGLGLAISYNLIKLHGGRIDVESTEQNTVFFIKLPI